MDTAGDVYITDRFDSQVLKLSAGSNNSIVLPFGGLGGPTGVAVDAMGKATAARLRPRRAIGRSYRLAA